MSLNTTQGNSKIAFVEKHDIVSIPMKETFVRGYKGVTSYIPKPNTLRYTFVRAQHSYDVINQKGTGV